MGTWNIAISFCLPVLRRKYFSASPVSIYPVVAACLLRINIAEGY
jgi:hypothetical protein